MTLQHIVLFSFPTPLDEREADEFRSIVLRWPSEIGTMKNLRLGQDLALVGHRAQGYQYLLYMEFDDQESFLAYRDHPAHVALSEFIRPKNCAVLAFDYELTADTVLN